MCTEVSFYGFFRGFFPKYSIAMFIWFCICAVSGFCLQHFWTIFVNKQIKLPRLMKYFPGIVYAFLTGLWHWNGNFVADPHTKLVFILTIGILIFVLCCILLRGMVWSNLYFIVTFFSINGLCYLTAFSTTTVLFGIRNFSSQPQRHRSTAALLLFGGLFCALLLFSFCLQVFRSRNLFHVVQAKELPLSLLPGVAGLLFNILSNKILIMLLSRPNQEHTLTEEAIYLLIPLCSLLCLLSVLSTNDLLRTVLRLGNEKSERIILVNQLQQIQAYIGQVEQFYADIRAMKHEMRNHLCNIQGLTRTNASPQVANDYIAQINDALDTVDFQYPTGHPVTDVILNSKLRQAQTLGISCSSLFSYPDDLGISAFDLGIILSNGLDNAIEACQKLLCKDPNTAEISIDVKSICKGYVFMLTIMNTFDGQPLVYDWVQLPQTTKPDYEAHGIGLHNIRNCAKKYGGDVDCHTQGPYFVLSVLLQGKKPHTPKSTDPDKSAPEEEVSC